MSTPQDALAEWYSYWTGLAFLFQSYITIAYIWVPCVFTSKNTCRGGGKVSDDCANRCHAFIHPRSAKLSLKCLEKAIRENCAPRKFGRIRYIVPRKNDIWAGVQIWVKYSSDSSSSICRRDTIPEEFVGPSYLWVDFTFSLAKVKSVSYSNK